MNVELVSVATADGVLLSGALRVGADHACTSRTDRLWTTVERWLAGDQGI